MLKGSNNINNNNTHVSYDYKGNDFLYNKKTFAFIDNIFIIDFLNIIHSINSLVPSYKYLICNHNIQFTFSSS